MKNRKLKWIGWLIVLAVVFGLGLLAGQRQPHHEMAMESHATTQPAKGERKIKYWWDPMLGPSSIRDHPGKSSMGMELVPVYEEPSSGSGELTIDPAIVQSMGVRVEEVNRGELFRTIRAAGYLTVAEPLRHDINLRVSGWIERLSADTVGMSLKKGQALFELYSPQLTVAVNELIAARRLKGSQEDLYQAARRKLILWGLPSEQVDQLARLQTAPATIPFFSPADGILTEKDVVLGSAVEAGQRVMRIVDQRTLWVDVQIDPSDMPWVRLNQSARVSFQGDPGRPWKGKVIFISPTVDPRTRTTTVRLSIDNPELKLRPGMYGIARLTARMSEGMLLAPRSAIIDTGDRQVAFVAKGEGHFEPRDVETGLVGSEDQVQILEGLSAGEQVVVSGQFMLDADSRMQEALRQFLEPEQVTGTGTGTDEHQNHGTPEGQAPMTMPHHH